MVGDVMCLARQVGLVRPFVPVIDGSARTTVGIVQKLTVVGFPVCSAKVVRVDGDEPLFAPAFNEFAIKAVGIDPKQTVESMESPHLSCKVVPAAMKSMQGAVIVHAPVATNEQLCAHVRKRVGTNRHGIK